jgi:capsular polysaccharide biosynthesis protein
LALGVGRLSPLVRFRPVTSRVLARVSQANLRASAIDVIEISPASTRPSPAPLFLPGELDRICAHHHEATPDHNIAVLSGAASTTHAATRAMLLKDILVANGAMMGARHVDVIRSGSREPLLTGAIDVLDQAVMCSDYVTENFFAHWLVDGSSHDQISRQLGKRPLRMSRAPWLHEPGYAALLGMAPRQTGATFIRHLWLLDDSGLNDGRMARLEIARERVRATAKPSGPPRVFVSRGVQARGRTLNNEPEVAAALATQGFVVLEPEHSDVATIIDTLAHAEMIVAVEGSALAHAALTAPTGAKLLIIQPPHHFNMLWKAVADGLNMPVGFTVGDPIDHHRFVQPIDRLLATLDLLEAA